MPRPSASRSAGLAGEITRTTPPGESAAGLTAGFEPANGVDVRGLGKGRVYTAARRGKPPQRIACGDCVNAASATQDPPLETKGGAPVKPARRGLSYKA